MSHLSAGRGQHHLQRAPQQAQRQVHLQEIIKQSYNEEYTREKYVSTLNVLNRIKSKLGSSPIDNDTILNGIETISELNKQISLLVDVYFNYNPVSTVSDCEQYVTTQLKDWMRYYKKMPPGAYESFEDFGVGSFRYNPHVMEKFKYKKIHADNLPNVSISDIIQTFVDIVSRSNTGRSTNHRIGLSTSSIVNLPEGMAVGEIIGKGGSVVKRLLEITGATRIKVDSISRCVTIQGTQEAIENCTQMIDRIHRHGVSAITYEEKFETRLLFELENKYHVTSIDSLGVMVKTKDLHKKISIQQLQSVKKVYDNAVKMFELELNKRLKVQWDVWLSRKAVKGNVLEWLSEETHSDAEDVYSHVSEYFDANDRPSFSVMLAAMLRVILAKAKSLSAGNPAIHNYKQNLAAPAASVGSKDEDEEDDDEEDDEGGQNEVEEEDKEDEEDEDEEAEENDDEVLFAVVISKENFRHFVLEFARIFPSLISLLTYGFDRPSILPSSDDVVHIGNVSSSNMELMAIDAFKKAVLSLAIPEDIVSSMRKLLEDFRSEISVKFEANKDINCDVNSQFNTGHFIKIFNEIFWQLVVKVTFKKTRVSVHSYCGDEKYEYDEEIQALSCFLLSPSDQTLDVFTTDDNKEFQDHLLDLADGSSVILIFQNVSADELMTLDPRTVEICRANCGAVSVPNEIGIKSSYLCFAVKGVLSMENIECKQDISSAKQLHLYIMNKELFQGLAGLHALYYSMVNYLSTIYSYSSPEDLFNTTGKLNETIFSQIEAVSADNLSDSMDVPAMFSKVFCAISAVESAVLKKLKIPSFDSLNSGSFVSYLTKDSAFVRGLLNRLFGDDEKLMISLGGNSGDTTAMERKSPRDRTRSTEAYRADPNVNIEYISSELCKIVGELDSDDMQLQGSSSLLNLFLKLQLMERGLLQIYNESGWRSTGFVDCTSLTFIQFIVSQLEMLQPDIVKQFTAICFPASSETVIQDVRHADVADVLVDDFQASLLVDCVHWFDQNYKQANQECDTGGLSGVVSDAVALLTRVTLKETSSLGDRADAYSSFIHKSEEFHSFRGHHHDGLLVYCPRQSMSVADHHVAPGDFDDPIFIGKVIAKLKAVPFGVRCSVGVNWKLLIRHIDSPKPIPEIPVLLKAHENALANANRKFMVISCDDAIPIPDALATTAEITAAVKSHDLYLLASWFLLAAVLDDHARMQFFNNCVAALRQAFISQTPEESTVSDNGWVIQLGIDIAGTLPDYMGSLVFTPWIKHIVTTYSSGIQVTTAEDNFCEHIMGLPLNERVVTGARISALLACSLPGDSTFSRIEDFFLRTDLTCISKSHSVPAESGQIAIRAANSANGSEKSDFLDQFQDSKSPASQLLIIGEGDNKLSFLGSTEEDFDETNPELCKKLITEIFNSAGVQSSFDGNLQNALWLLSEQNSLAEHFVLEVIQNAADSTYPTAVAPTLLIQLHREKIVVKTNEVGFSRANVKAITAVGMSHKKKIAGYIGHKGIGFKTVFKVTDKPQIHSKGFHFYFDKTQGSLIAPYWIEDTGTSWSYSNNPHYRTSIVLPLNEEALDTFPKLKENIYLVFDKNLLLFLGKLSVMILEDFTVTGGKLTTFRRFPLTDHWLKCEHEEVSTDFWYIKRKRFFPSVRKPTDDVKSAIAETEIAVAFNFCEDLPLEVSDSGGDNLAAEPSKKGEDDVDVKVERSSLRLTVSKDSMPIYSFLPTKTAAFKFIVQADFVLISNRESLVDHNPYNQQLIFQLTNLITEIFQEFALHLQFQIDLANNGSGSSADKQVNPALSQLCEICDRHKLVLTPEAVVALLPRPYSCSIHKEIQKNLSEKICYNLRNCRIFLSTEGVLCDAATLLVAPIFPDVITDFLPESVLFKLIGKRFPHPSLVLDDDLKTHFKVKQLCATDIVDCLEEAVSEAGPYLEAAERVHVVSRLLVVLAILTTEMLSNSANQSSAATGAMKRPHTVRIHGLIPSAVTKMQLKQQGQSTGAGVSKIRQLSLDLLNRLKKLPLWPLTSGVFVSSEANSLFMQSSNDLPRIVLQCMPQYLTQFIHVIDEGFFNSADTASHNFGGFLKEFVAVNFKPTVGHSGLHFLTSTMLLSNVLVPALIDRNNSPTVDQACALLACTYICSDKARMMDLFLHAAGVWIPAVNVRESKDKGNKTWTTDSDHVVYVSSIRDETGEATNIDEEVHLGPEFLTSATSRLFSTLMKQIGWKFIHPKVYCLIYEVEFREDVKDRSDLFTDIQSKLSSDSGVANLKTFLKKAGVINFFKGYKRDDGSSCVCTAPSLAAVLSKLLANSEPVCSRDNYNQAALFLFQSENSQRAQQSSVSLKRRDQSEEQLITHTENQSIYDLIKVELLDLIREELQDVIPREKRMVAQVVTELLNRYPCIPVKVNDLQHPSIPKGKLLLASIDAAVIPNYQSFYWSHLAYVDLLPQTTTTLQTLFDTVGVRKILNFQKIAFPELVNIFSWMSRQHQVVASVEMMSDIYFRIQAVLSDTQQLVDFKAEISLLRDLFSSDAPVLWFPSSYNMRDGDSRTNGDSKMTSGRMYRPSDVVLFGVFDVTGKFPLLMFPGCPIRVLSYHYDETIVGFFKREVYCNYCKLVEGFYCFQGLPIGETIRCGSTDTLRCCCRGSKMEPLSHSKRGLIKSSLTLKDWVSVTNALQSKLDTEGNARIKKDFKDSETVAKSLVVESPEDERFLQQFTAETYQYIFKASFESINRALYKCFTQVDGLFPYAPKDVQALKDMWCNKDFLWPLKWKDSSCWLSFKNTSSMVTLVVENAEMFLPFSNELAKYSNNIRVLDLTFTSSKESGLLYPSIHFTPLTSPAPSLDEFENRYAQFLKQDKHVIDHRCNLKPLFQPLQCFPLLCTDLLPNTIRLSEIISTRLHYHSDVASTGSVAASFMQQHIVRLYITLAFLQRDYNFAFNSLMGDGVFYNFLRSKITVVDELYVQSTLDLGKALSLISINEVSLLPFDLHIPYHVDSKSDACCLKVYLHDKLLTKLQLKEKVKTFTSDYLLEPLVRRRLAQYPGAFESLNKLLGDLDNVLLENLWDHLGDYDYPPLSEETIARIQSYSDPILESANVDEDSDDAQFDGAETNLAAFLRLDKSLKDSKREAKKAFLSAPIDNVGEEHSLVTSTPNTGNSPRIGSSSSSVANNGGELVQPSVSPPSDEISTAPPVISNNSTTTENYQLPPTTTIAAAAYKTTEVNIRVDAAGAGHNSLEILHRDGEKHPFFNKPVTRGVEILNINIEDDALLLSSIAALVNNEAGGSSQLDASTAANVMHGKVGELIAEKQLRLRFPNCTIQWMNKDMESMEPYDFLVTDTTCSSSPISRFVEVKTRVSPEPVSQWFISRNELLFASAKHEEAYYSCLFIHLVEVGSNNRGAASSKALKPRSSIWVDDLMNAAASGDDTGLQFSVQIVHNNTAR